MENKNQKIKTYGDFLNEDSEKEYKIRLKPNTKK